jgi:hypothetical protein
MDDPVRWAAALREESVRRGIPGLFLCNVMSIGDADRLAGGFDAAVEFPPNGTLGRELRPRMLGAKPPFRGKIYDYASVVQTMLARPTLPLPYFPGVMPRWDNTARKGLRAHVFHGSTPELFEEWLRRAALITTHRNPEAPLLFVNSWNEWAEGAHLEPDELAGGHYLEAVRRVVADDAVESLGPSTSRMRADTGDPAPVALTSGLPSGFEGAAHQASDGFVWIDSVDGKPLVSHVVSVTREDAVLLRGWFYGDSRAGGRGRERAYLLLSAGKSVWHAPVTYWHPRPDLMRGMRSTSRKSRKMVRAIDRLPPSLARPVFRLWSRDRDRFGFEVQINVADLPEGMWNIGMLEVNSLGVRRVASEFRLSRR